jgi:hypothetical protein
MQYVSTRAAGGYRMRTYSERPPEVRLVVQRGDGRARVVRLRSRSSKMRAARRGTPNQQRL